MVGNEFKLTPHNVLTKNETEFVSRFYESKDKNMITAAIIAGVSVEEIRSLRLDETYRLTMKMQAALYLRYKYKCSYRVACRIMDNGFSEKQLDTIVNVLLMPAFAIPEEKVLNEILYDRYSAEDMLAWYNKVRNS